MSRHHARLFVSYQDWSIADLGSANGTHLGDEPVGEEPAKVRPSQIIRVGDATFELRALESSDPDATLMPTQEAVRRHLPPELQGTRRYQIGKQVAKGGMGAILEALDVSTRRNVAMKVMLNITETGDILRFIEEAQVTAQLEHPNIVPVHELSVNEQGEVFYTMKMVRGITLKKVIELLAKGVGDVAKKYPLAALLTIFQKVCDAIAFAHSKGVIHRDLKPENIMLGDYGEVLVMDWGLARLVGSTERASVVRSAKADEGDALRTQTGSIMGTPTYMSPEQARGEIEKLDARSDIYALGTILFELLHLRPVVTGTEVMQIVSKVQRGAVEWGTGKTQIPASLLAVCRKALALSIAARYPRVEDLQADLLAYQNGFATSAENAGAWKQFTLLVKRHKALFGSAAAAAVSIAVVVGVAFQQVTGERNVAVGERNRAETALTSLAKTAPTFAAMAKGLVEQGNLEGALEKIGYAVSLEKGNADYLLQQANLLQATQQLTAAAESYRAVLALRADAAAKQNLELCEKLLRDNAGGSDLKRESLGELAAAMIKQGRAVEAAPLSQILGKGSDTALAAIKARMKPLLAITGPGAGVSRLPNGTFRLDLIGKPVVELPPLDGLPITEVDISGTKVSDLTPLKGLRLQVLRITNTPVTDLSPLAGMPLEVLDASETKIKELAPLKGMRLKELNLNASRGFFDLSPLRGMALKKVIVPHTSVVDLSPIEGMPITDLVIINTGVSDLGPLAGMPLGLLQAGGTKITNLSPLRGCPFHSLHLQRTPVSDLSPLAGMSIVDLNITDTKVTDISVLPTLPRLKRLGVQCPVKDLRPLADCKTLEGLEISKVTSDISFLRGLPKLQRLGDEPNGGEWMSKDTPTAEQFWQKYDAERAAPK